MKLKRYITAENLLCLFIILCPFMDMASYWFRRIAGTEFSIATVLRPIIPVIISLYIFIKAKKKEKIILIGLSLVYIAYAVLHIVVTKNMFMESAYGTIKNEAQYVLNFTSLVVYFIIYNYIFVYRKKDLSNDESFIKLKHSIAIMTFTYVVSVFLAITTRSSEYTYIETSVGYKGWYAQGNSLSAVLIMSLFILLGDLKNTKWKKFYITTIIITTIYLVFIIGTRAALLGALLSVIIYIVCEVLFSRNKKIIITSFVFMIIGVGLVGVIGSNTIKRRQQVDQARYTIIDEATGEVGTMTGDMLRLKNKILAGNVDDNYMTEAQRQSVLDLYEYTQKNNTPGNDTRTQQLMYNIYLVKNQKNPLLILFGNGYKSNVGEMIMENELASIPLNFGIIGCILYVGPFVALLVYSIIVGIKRRRIVDSTYIMLQCGLAMSLILSWFSGYVLFAMSDMVVMAVISTLIYARIRRSDK